MCLLAASFDGLRPLLVARHCQFCSLANKLRSFVRVVILWVGTYLHILSYDD